MSLKFHWRIVKTKSLKDTGKPPITCGFTWKQDNLLLRKKDEHELITCFCMK